MGSSTLRRFGGAVVPDSHGLYAIRLVRCSILLEPFGTLLSARSSRLIYNGLAEKQTLVKRLIGNELRAKGNGTFIRSIGAVLGGRSQFGSPVGRARVQNYRFAPLDRIAAVEQRMPRCEVVDARPG